MSAAVAWFGKTLGNWNDRRANVRWIDRVAGWLYKKGDPR